MTLTLALITLALPLTLTRCVGDCVYFDIDLAGDGVCDDGGPGSGEGSGLELGLGLGLKFGLGSRLGSGLGLGLG